jgi:hypothetical protein
MDYTDVATALDKLRREEDFLRQMGDKPVTDDTVLAHATQMLAQSKRVRSTSNLVVRALARLRDQLQSQEDTSE